MEKSLSSSRVVVHNAFYNFLGFISSAAYLFFLIPTVLGYLGIEQYGLWSVVIALTTYLGLADLGMGMSFMKFISEYYTLRDYETMNRVIQHGLLFYLGVACLILICGILLFPLFFEFLNIPIESYDLARNTFLLALISFGFTSIGIVFGGVLAAIQRMDVHNLLAVTLLVTRFAAILAVLHLGYGLIGMMAAEIATTVLFTIPLVVLTKRLLPQVSFRLLTFDTVLMRRLLSFGAQLQVSRLAEIIQLQFDKLLLTRYVGLPAVSIYDFGSRPLLRLRALPLATVSSLIPAISVLTTRDDHARIQAALVRSLRYLVLIALPGLAFLLVFAHEIIFLWLGAGYGQAATTLQIFSFAYFISAVAGIVGYVSQGRGEPKYQMQAMILQLTLNILLSIVLLRLFGFFGAVAGTTMAMIIGSMVFLYRYIPRILDHPITTLWEVCYKPTLSILPATALVLLLTYVVEYSVFFGSRGAALGSIVIACIVFSVVYLLTLRVTGALTVDDKGFVEGVLPERLKPLLRFF